MNQSDANGIFEVILHMQGVLKDKKLPPIRSGLVGQHEEKTATPMTIHHPHTWPEDNGHEGHNGMTNARDVEAPYMNPTTVNPEMDKNAFIKRMNATNGMFVYGEENVVLYGEEWIDATGHKKTVRIPPQRLHVGDIVYVAFSRVTFGRGSELKARLLLGNITLLDATHTKKWLKEKVKPQSLNIRMQPTLK
ncbi:uncharacterized protein C8R40DRAFT_1070122 [Lentinula edodes]|uniref:uncharacterized protein n=1 Tax=Lentinula edodes TaxID=5353 RepID=UPI001E8CE69C|nr:uncharacterized protein C8R40DRAFT_1070122 [Lentinula edodes]KAH7874311.1 hypothetical protein C8R40DRAFT_1070122 [Lentinula edodes]